MNEPVKLSLEQQFELKAFESQVKRMSLQQAQDFLVKLREHMMMRETMYRQMMRSELGIDTMPKL